MGRIGNFVRIHIVVGPPPPIGPALSYLHSTDELNQCSANHDPSVVVKSEDNISNKPLASPEFGIPLLHESGGALSEILRSKEHCLGLLLEGQSLLKGHR